MDGKRRPGRQATRCRDEIHLFSGNKWSILAQDRVKWKNMGKIFIQQWTANGCEMTMIKRQENILHIYINQIHPERQCENDMIWMNKYIKNKNDKLEKKHKEKFQNLITEK